MTIFPAVKFTVAKSCRGTPLAMPTLPLSTEYLICRDQVVPPGSVIDIPALPEVRPEERVILAPHPNRRLKIRITELVSTSRVVNNFAKKHLLMLVARVILVAPASQAGD